MELPPQDHELVVHECIVEAAEHYNVPQLLLKAIRETEGGKVGQIVGPNRNGTSDLGVMQINTIWLEELKEFGISKEDLLNDACTNVYVGAWILRGYYDYHDRDWQKAIMSYNAGFKLENGVRYAQKVIYKWNKLHESYVGKNDA